MRAYVRGALVALCLVAPVMMGTGCFSVEEPACSFACGPNGACPDDYLCLPDGYCHLHGQMNACGYPDGGSAADLGAQDLGPDMPVTLPPDLSLPPADLSSADM